MTTAETPRRNPLAHAHVSNAAHAISRRLLRPGEKLLFIGESPAAEARRDNVIIGVLLALVAALVWKLFGFSLGFTYDAWFGANVSRTPPGVALAMGAFFLLFFSVPVFAALGCFRRATAVAARAVVLTDQRLSVFEVTSEPRAVNVESLPLSEIRSSTVVRMSRGRERWTVNGHWPHSETSETTGRTFSVKAGALEAQALLESLVAARKPSLSGG